MMSIHVRVAAMLAAVAAAAFLSSCGAPAGNEHIGHTGNSPSQNAPADHNGADVMFAQNMIPHHQQAVEMAAMIPTHTANADMQVIAYDISTDQRAEIRTMTSMLSQWGVAPDAHGQGGHGGMGMAGMVDQTTMNELQSLKGPAFDELWLRSMIAHHQGAVTMAQGEIANGQSRDAIEMAKRIITAQQREIAYMNHLLSATQ